MTWWPKRPTRARPRQVVLPGRRNGHFSRLTSRFPALQQALSSALPHEAESVSVGHPGSQRRILSSGFAQRKRSFNSIFTQYWTLMRHSYLLRFWRSPREPFGDRAWGSVELGDDLAWSRDRVSWRGEPWHPQAGFGMPARHFLIVQPSPAANLKLTPRCPPVIAGGPEPGLVGHSAALDGSGVCCWH